MLSPNGLYSEAPSLRGKVNYLSGKGFDSKIATIYHSVGRMLIRSFEEGGQGVH
jgi:hypothetical protein